jgi:hypothetical protein
VFHALLQLFLYAFLASFSALALAATIAVLRTGHLKSVAFAFGFVGGQLFTCALFVLLGVAATGSTRESHHEVEAVIELVLALVLVALALRIRARGPIERRRSSTRAPQVLERLGRLRLLTMLLAGSAFGVGGPKRLILTALAATAISTSGAGGAGESLLVLFYVALASAVVWVPVLLYLFFGARIVARMSGLQEALARHQREAVFYALLVLAGAFVVDALTLL